MVGGGSKGVADAMKEGHRHKRDDERETVVDVNPKMGGGREQGYGEMLANVTPKTRTGGETGKADAMNVGDY